MSTAAEIKEIQIRWVGDISQLTGEIDASRKEIEDFKTIMRSMGAETEESLAVVESAFRRTFDVKILDPLRAKIAEMKVELKSFEGLPIGAQQLAKDQGIVIGTGEDLIAEQETLRRLTDGVKISVSELRKEFLRNAEAAQTSFKDASTATDHFRSRVNEAKLELQRLVAEGKKLSDAKVGLETTGRFEPKQLAQANKEVEASIKAQEKAYKELEKSINSAASAAKKSAEQVAKANKDSALETDKWRISVNAAKKELTGLVASGRKLDDAFQGMKTAGKYTAPQLSQALKEVKVESGEVKKGFSALGNVAQRVFRSIVGFVVLGILRKLLTSFNEITEQGKEAARAILDVSIAVRKLQRAGTEISVQEVADMMENLREEFGIFSEKEIKDATASLLILGDRTNLTKDQMFELAHAMAVASAVSGVDFSEGMERALRAISTGRTQGLIELQLGISQLQVIEEAYNSGLVERGQTVDALSKQQATYNLIIEQSKELEEDAALIQEKLSGQIQATEASWTDLKDLIGKKLLPGKLSLLSVSYSLVKAYLDLQEAAQRLGIAIINFVYRPMISLMGLLEEFRHLLSGAGIDASRLTNRVKELGAALDESLNSYLFPSDEDFGLPDVPIGEVIEEETDDVKEAGDELDNTLKDLYIKLRESMISGEQDVARENRNFFQDMFKKMQKFIFKMQQLAEKYAFDVEKIWRDYRDKLSEIDIKYREKEIKAEEDFQDKMRKLRAKFLLDLEEALENRDARQILRLIRNFNARADELRREKEKEAKDRKQEESNEKAALARRRDQRLRDLKLENDFRTKQLIAQNELERKLAWEDHKNRLDELDTRAEEREAKITRLFKDEHDITEMGAALVVGALEEYFGANGHIDLIYAGLLTRTDTFISTWMTKLRTMSRFGLNFGGLFGGEDGGYDHNPDAGKIEDIKKRIKDPNLNKSTGLSTGFTSPSFSLPNSPIITQQISQQQKVAIEIGLDKGLTGEIVEQTLGEVANVFIRVTN